MRSLRVSWKGDGFSWLARLLGLAAVLVPVAPVVFLMLPLGLLDRRGASAGPENELTDPANP